MNFLPSTQNIFSNQFYIVYQIHPAFMNYCVCRETYVHQPASELSSSFCDCNMDDKLNEVEDPPFTQSYMFTELIKKRSKTNYMLREIDFEAKAQNLLRNIISKSLGGGILIFSRKKAIAKFGPISRKRSTYIGVMRNGDNWQAFITVNNKKIYIGSYKTEKEAAIVFDFYCILQHSLIAKTNFDYTKDSVIMMIASFIQNNGYFKPKTEYLLVKDL